MDIIVLPESLAVCQVATLNGLDLTHAPCHLAVTDDEISVVIASDRVPAQALSCDDGWQALKVAGVLDFALVGILAELATILADAKVSIFALSTYNTDYLLVKTPTLPTAIAALQAHGHHVQAR